MKTKIVTAEYIEKGTFQSSAEECFNADIITDIPYVVISEKNYNAMKNALEKISEFDNEPIWHDDRDDAADLMVDIAIDALNGKYDYDENI